MNKILSKIVILLMIFNLTVPSVAFSQESIQIYNCGEIVNFSKDVGEYNGKIYINEADLGKLNLKKVNDIIADFNYDTMLAVYPGSSLIEVNDSTMLYANAAIIINSEVYISLDLIAMLFSDLYEVGQKRIDLWIDKYYSNNFVRGSVSLPNGEVAPRGGLSVNVFVTKPNEAGGAGGNGSSTAVNGEIVTGIGTPGYKGLSKPSYKNLENLNEYLQDFEKQVEKTVIIPEGYSRTDFTLYKTDGTFIHSNVGYRTELNGHICVDTIPFKRVTDKNYDFTIEASVASVQGTVTLPQTTDKDVHFSVVAKGKTSYKCDGVIPTGEASADYLLGVGCDESYSMLVLFEEGEYKRTEIKDTVLAAGKISDVDFCAEKADKYNVTVKLPEGFEIKEDLYATVYLQSAEAPNYIVDSKKVAINAGQTGAYAVLYNDMQLNDLICYYVLSESCDGLFDFGHYSSNGASFWVENADYVDNLNNIEMELIATKQITANISLPNEETALEDISVDIYPITTVYPTDNSKIDDAVVLLSTSVEQTNEGNGNAGGSGGGGFSGGIAGTTVTIAPTISSGENEGEVIVSIPNEKDFGYTLEVTVYDGSQRYYRQLYYNEEKSTVIASNATPVTVNDDSISIELMKQYKISGSINAVGYESGHNIINAIMQKDRSIRNDIYGQEISIYDDIYGNADYELFVPDEFDNYILRLRSCNDGDFIYYAKPKATEKLEESELIVVNSDTDNINFNYDGYRPVLPIKTTALNAVGNTWTVDMSVIGDFGVEGIMNYIALYDENDRLISLKASDKEVSLSANESCETEIKLSADELAYAAYAKLFTWSGMKPVAEAVYIKEPNNN